MIELLVEFISKFVALFLRTSGSYSFPPPLDKEEESRLFERYRQGDKAARSKLIEHNLRLVAHIVKKYYTAAGEQDDLISVGTIGLIKAIDTYDSKKGARFATYAGKCLQNEILMYFRAQKKYACETSINEPVDIDKDGNPLTYMDILPCDGEVSDEIDESFRSEALYRALRESLTSREKEVIVLRSGLCGVKPVPQREVAKRLGISRSYVSRIEKTAMDKIRKHLAERGFNL